MFRIALCHVYRQRYLYIHAPVLLLVALLVWWAWLDRIVLGPAMVPISVTPLEATVQAGGLARVRWVYEIARDCERTVELHLINGQSRLLKRHSGSTAGRPPGRREIMGSTPIPSDVHPGPATLISIGHFRCTPLDTQTVAMQAQLEIVQ